MPVRLVGHRADQAGSHGASQRTPGGAAEMKDKRSRHIYSSFRIEAEEVANRLSQGQRRWLIDHAHGPRPLIRQEHALLRDKMTTLRVIEQPRSLNPKHTYLTDFGREVLIILLQREIDKLVDAGCLDPDAQPLTTAWEAFDAPIGKTRKVKA